MSTDTRNKRDFDLIVWGASGFTGRLVAEYLLGQQLTQNMLYTDTWQLAQQTSGSFLTPARDWP